MKNLSLILGLFFPFFSYGQLSESFTDGDFTQSPNWIGTTDNFFVNSLFQLQSKASAASTSSLFTSSESFVDAHWECSFKVNYTTSSSNYAAFYIASDKSDVSLGCTAYFVKIGDTQDDVSLWIQEGLVKTKIIDGLDKRLDTNPVEVRVKVTRDAFGVLTLYSKLPSETEYLLEGQTTDLEVKKSNYLGLMYVNTSTTGNAYLFDEVLAIGTKAVDMEAPTMSVLIVEESNSLVLQFSESVDISHASFTVDNGMGSPVSIQASEDGMTLTLTFAQAFQKGQEYQLEVDGLMDLTGNELIDTEKRLGILEQPDSGDLRINEVMFEQPLNSLEYIEIVNCSDKILDISGLVYTSRKTDGSLSTANSIPANTQLLPQSYLAICQNADSVRNYHHAPTASNIISSNWSSLNNEGATLVLTNAAKDTIFDELTYSVTWHHPLVKDPKGVALERIHPLLPTQDANSWHSASSEFNYGTPGSINSQYRAIDTPTGYEKIIWVEPLAFSPDNDGVDDICLIHYLSPESGCMANALIFNPSGVQIVQLADNALLSTEGILSWDGSTDTGKVANVGIYVLYFELFNPTSGLRKQLKLPIVVSAR